MPPNASLPAFYLNFQCSLAFGVLSNVHVFLWTSFLIISSDICTFVKKELCNWAVSLLSPLLLARSKGHKVKTAVAIIIMIRYLLIAYTDMVA